MVGWQKMAKNRQIFVVRTASPYSDFQLFKKRFQKFQGLKFLFVIRAENRQNRFRVKIGPKMCKFLSYGNLRTYCKLPTPPRQLSEKMAKNGQKWPFLEKWIKGGKTSK